MPDKMEELSEERTRTAHVRTLLAEERTFSAWIRTGLASVVAGLAVVELLRETGPRWLITLVGIVFLTAGAAMFVLAFLGYRGAVQASVYRDARSLPVWLLAGISLAMLLCAFAGLGLVVMRFWH